MNKKIVSFIKLISIIYLIIVLPKVISDNGNNQINIKSTQLKSRTGFENLVNTHKQFAWLKKLNLGLISDNIQPTRNNHSHKIDQLLHQGFKIKNVFVCPESKPANNKAIKSNKKSIPIFRWNSEETLLSKKQLCNIDAMLFDVTSSGMRHDFCFQILKKAMKSAQKNNKKLVVLDNPNPLGRIMEGPGQIPIRPGMTIGELAIYINKYSFKKNVDLTVIPMTDWKRNHTLIGLKTKQIPNKMTSLNSCYGYSFLGLLNEIDPIEVSTNVNLAFQTILLPEGTQLSSWEVEYLKKICGKLGLSCKNYSYYDENKKINLRGIKIRVKKDINSFSSFNALITLGRFFKNRKNINLSYSDTFDKMIGTNDTKSFLQNNITFDELKNNTQSSLTSFYTKAKDCFLYKPFPTVKEVQLIRG